MISYIFIFRSYQVRGHLAAQIDPLNINNKTRQEAKKLVIRSVQVQDSDMDNVYQLPETTWIGGTVRNLLTSKIRFEFFKLFEDSSSLNATDFLLIRHI